MEKMMESNDEYRFLLPSAWKNERVNYRFSPFFLDLDEGPAQADCRGRREEEGREREEADGHVRAGTVADAVAGY